MPRCFKIMGMLYGVGFILMCMSYFEVGLALLIVGSIVDHLFSSALSRILRDMVDVLKARGFTRKQQAEGIAIEVVMVFPVHSRFVWVVGLYSSCKAIAYLLCMTVLIAFLMDIPTPPAVQAATLALLIISLSPTSKKMVQISVEGAPRKGNV